MNDELGHQEQVLTRVTDHVERTQMGLDDVSKSAEKTLGKAGGVGCKSNNVLPKARCKLHQHCKRAPMEQSSLHQPCCGRNKCNPSLIQSEKLMVSCGCAGTKKVHRKYMPSQTKVASQIASVSRNF